MRCESSGHPRWPPCGELEANKLRHRPEYGFARICPAELIPALSAQPSVRARYPHGAIERLIGADMAQIIGFGANNRHTPISIEAIAPCQPAAFPVRPRSFVRPAQIGRIIGVTEDIDVIALGGDAMNEGRGQIPASHRTTSTECVTVMACSVISQA